MIKCDLSDFDRKEIMRLINGAQLQGDRAAMVKHIAWCDKIEKALRDATLINPNQAPGPLVSDKKPNHRTAYS